MSRPAFVSWFSLMDVFASISICRHFSDICGGCEILCRLCGTLTSFVWLWSYDTCIYNRCIYNNSIYRFSQEGDLTTDAVKVDHLVKIFNSTIRAVDDISFQIEEGEIFGLLGPNGAGKSTTISILTTLLRPTEGRAWVAGHDVERNPKTVRAMIGLVPQDLTSDQEMTGRENMLLQGDIYHVSRDVSEPRIDEIFELVDLTDAADRLVGTYSGGMRKRLELAEGLINRPSILFLDEPTLGLDVQTRSMFWEYIDQIRRENNTTILLTTHYLDEADSLCDRIAIIDHGKIVAMGTPTELKKCHGGEFVEMIADGDGDITSILKGVDGVDDVIREGDRFRIVSSEGEELIPQLIEATYGSGVKIRSVRVDKPNLDQVFLQLTGRSLRDEGDSNMKKASKSKRGGRG